MRILITGISGFIGSYLAEYCLPNAEVFGTYILENELKRIEHIKDKIQVFKCNLLDKVAVEKVIKKSKPDKIFHLAAQNYIPASWESPEHTLSNNIISQVNIFEVIRKMKINPIILIACTSGEYGLVFENELPIKETNPLRPLSPYAVSKLAQEQLGFVYHKSYGFKTILTRFFAVEGPRRGKDFFIPSMARQIVEIEREEREPVIYVGNLEGKKDLSDVRDIAMACLLASEKCKFGEPYNICSEKARSMRSVLDLLLSLSKVKNIKIKQDPRRMRPLDVPILVGDCSKFKKQTGWEPKIDFKDTLKDTLDYWRSTISL